MDLTAAAPYNMSPTAKLSALRLLKEHSPSRHSLNAEVASLQHDQGTVIEPVALKQLTELDRIRTKARYWKLADQDVASPSRCGNPKATTRPKSAPPVSASALVTVSTLRRSVTAALFAIIAICRKHPKALFSLPVGGPCRR